MDERLGKESFGAKEFIPMTPPLIRNWSRLWSGQHIARHLGIKEP